MQAPTDGANMFAWSLACAAHFVFNSASLRSLGVCLAIELLSLLVQGFFFVSLVVFRGCFVSSDSRAVCRVRDGPTLAPDRQGHIALIISESRLQHWYPRLVLCFLDPKLSNAEYEEQQFAPPFERSRQNCCHKSLECMRAWYMRRFKLESLQSETNVMAEKAV